MSQGLAAEAARSAAVRARTAGPSSIPDSGFTHDVDREDVPPLDDVDAVPLVFPSQNGSFSSHGSLVCSNDLPQ